MTVNVSIKMKDGRTEDLFEAEVSGRAPYMSWNAVTVPSLTENELYAILSDVYKSHRIQWLPGHRPGEVFLAPAYRLTPYEEAGNSDEH